MNKKRLIVILIGILCTISIIYITYKVDAAKKVRIQAEQEQFNRDSFQAVHYARKADIANLINIWGDSLPAEIANEMEFEESHTFYLNGPKFERSSTWLRSKLWELTLNDLESIKKHGNTGRFSLLSSSKEKLRLTRAHLLLPLWAPNIDLECFLFSHEKFNTELNLKRPYRGFNIPCPYPKDEAPLWDIFISNPDEAWRRGVASDGRGGYVVPSLPINEKASAKANEKPDESSQDALLEKIIWGDPISHEAEFKSAWITDVDCLIEMWGRPIPSEVLSELEYPHAGTIQKTPRDFAQISKWLQGKLWEKAQLWQHYSGRPPEENRWLKRAICLLPLWVPGQKEIQSTACPYPSIEAPLWNLYLVNPEEAWRRGVGLDGRGGK